jgi:hypothetical protein
MPADRFVILEHTWQSPPSISCEKGRKGSGVHFDLMLEVRGKLRTWRLASPPVAGVVQRVEASFDHRLVYLDYEGELSGGRGHVRRWDRGQYLGEAGDSDTVTIILLGERLFGRLQLQHATGADWDLAFTPTRCQ